MSEELFQIAKSKCYLTDDLSPEEKTRLQYIVEDAIVKIAHYIGVPSDFDFTQPGFARELFKNYVWYAWNDCEEEFASNYQNDIYIAQNYYSSDESESAADE